MKTSQTGGYILPSETTPIPRHLNLTQFIQTVLVGISGIDGTLVRPKWQTEPLKQPPLETNWLAFGVGVGKPDANAYTGQKPDGTTTSQRHEELEVSLTFYGPEAMEYAGLVRDGFQIQQNLDGLRSANMGFVETTLARHIPDLVNERFLNRVESSVILRREVQRLYPITSFVTASGTVHTVLGDEEYLFNWQTQTPP